MDIPYGKVAIYLLTFLGYVYTGYGSGLLNTLRDAVLSAENVFGDVFNNVITVAKRFKDFHDVLDAAVEEECIFTCPNGKTPVPNRNHAPKSNGCGSVGLNIASEYLPISEMTKCCDVHDLCYDTCKNVKEVCDMEFKRCLYKYCDTYKNTVGETVVKTCKAAAKMLFTGTLTLGCKSYMDAQKNACFCPGQQTEYKNKKYFTGKEEL